MEQAQNEFFLIFLGCIAISCMFIKALFSRFALSPIPALIIFGLVVRYFYPYQADSAYQDVIQLFGDIGLIFILFQVGISSNLKELFRQIKNAIAISITEVSISAIVVLLGLFYFLDSSFHNSLLVGIAFTATSIAVTVSLWDELNVLKTKTGQLLLDLSALDDIAGITLVAVMFGFLQNGSNHTESLLSVAFYTPIVVVALKLIAIMVVCYLFSLFLEPKLSKLLAKYELIPDPVITIICLALIFSDIVGYFGLSIALGAFFLGLSFSRDANTVKMLQSYRSLELFFVPFFFFSVGFSITDFDTIAIYPILILLLAVIGGKVIGVMIPSSLLKLPFKKSLLLGLSMVPRAEITLFILHYGKLYLNLPPAMYTASVLVVLLTCFFPLVLKPLIIAASRKDPDFLSS